MMYVIVFGFFSRIDTSQPTKIGLILRVDLDVPMDLPARTDLTDIMANDKFLYKLKNASNQSFKEIEITQTRILLL